MLLHCRIVSLRRLIIAAILVVCLGAPIAEMFDQWDHTYQDGNDTETNLIVAALCVGLALAAAGILVSRVRALSSRFVVHVFASSRIGVTASFFVLPVRTNSPPLSLRV
jgi:hypothetical protein